MLTKVRSCNTVRGPLHYNESKVSQGKALCIGADNFLKSHDRLTLQDKLDRFDQRTSLNERVVKEAYHISINFGTSEALSNSRLITLVERSMNTLGFENQPWLAYGHYDTAHTHVHVVTTGIQADGLKLQITPSQLVKLHALNKELEEKFSLQPSTKASPSDQEQFAVDSAQRVIYGESGLKHSISDVLNTVVPHYQYSNLDEFNAVLHLYNVDANPGEAGSTLRSRNGLLYHAVDESGNHIGVPLRASDFLLKPTLNNLEQRFYANRSAHESAAENLRTTIDWTLAGQTPDWKGLTTDLAQKGVSVIMSRSVNDSKEHLYFIDHNQKAVFNAGTLGKDYDLRSLQQRCAPIDQTQHHQETHIHQLKL